MGTAYQLAQKARAFERTAWLHDSLYGQYSLYSHRVQDIVRDSVPEFQARSIDEFVFDVSGCDRLFSKLYGGIAEFAEYLRRRVRSEVGLPLSIGIGPSRIIAKMASRHAKPDGVFRVLPEEVEAFLGPHDVQAVPGIGPVTAQKLRNLGLVRVEQLLAMARTNVRAVLGNGFLGLVDTLLAGGAGNTGELPDAEAAEDGSPARPALPKTIGHETTFERDLLDPALLEETLWTLTEDACRRLREKGLLARHVTVKLRYSDFATHTHGGFFEQPTDVDSAVFGRVKELFWRAHRRLRVRLVGVRLDRLTPGGNQPGLFDPPQLVREQNLIRAVDRVRDKYGRAAHP
jgi:DNA polymerase-4